MGKQKETVKESKEIQKVESAPRPLVTPDFMREADKGLELVRQYVVPPRLKIIQKSASNDLFEHYGLGDVIIVPDGITVLSPERANNGRPTLEDEPFFLFCPLFMFPEWVAWTDYNTRGNAPVIMDRTTDPNHPLRAKCKSQRFRDEKVNGVLVHNVEHLNFIVRLLDPDIPEKYVILSFARGEWKSGSSFCNLLQLRNAPLYGCVFEASLAYRPGTGKGDWYGLDISNPKDQNIPAFVSAETFKVHQELWKGFAEGHKAGMIRPTYDEDFPEEETAEPTSGAARTF